MINKKIISATVLLALIGISVYYRNSLSVEFIEKAVTSAGMAGILFFIGFYALATILFMPGIIMTLAGGALYGPYAGTVINLTGATLGATASFLIARYFAGSWVQEKTGSRLQALQTGIEAEGWKFVAFTRLVPLFPFNLLNYALGLTKISLSRYILCTFVFMIPGGAAYTYLGFLGKEAAKGQEGLIRKILLGIAAVSFAFFIPRIAGFFRKGKELNVEELKQQLDRKETFLLLDVRSENEFRQDPGHINGAVNIPDSLVKLQPEQLEKYREAKIAVICRTDRRSAGVAKFLISNGFGDVHLVRGGMVDWQAKGFPVIKGS